jgi:hypothetical protein
MYAVLTASSELPNKDSFVYFFPNKIESIRKNTRGQRITFILKHQFPYALVLIVVPYHNLVRGVSRVSTTPNDSDQVASKEHFNYTNTYRSCGDGEGAAKERK